MKDICLLYIIVMVSIGFTQAPDTLWTKTYGGSGNDVGNSIKQTSDGGYIIAGYTESFGAGQQDVWLLKTDANGDTVWTKTYGGTENDWATDVQQTIDSGYIVGANTESFGMWLLRIDALGDTIWTKNMGSGQCNSVLQTQYGEYVLTGHYWGGMTGDYVLLYKTDIYGDTIWCRMYGPIAMVPSGRCVCVTSDGGYIIAGDGVSLWPSLFSFVFKTDVQGDVIWEKWYCDTIWDYGLQAVDQTVDGGYVACGLKEPRWTEEAALWIERLNSQGNVLWTREFGGSTNTTMYGNSVQLTTDSGYIVTGGQGTYWNPFGNLFLIKTNENGDSLWCVFYGDSAYSDCGNEVLQTNDDGYIVVGSTESYGAGGSDVWIIKTEPDVGVEEQPIVSPVEKRETITATIFRGPLQLPEGRKCRVFDITGRVVMPEKMKPGVYFVEIEGEIKSKVIKIH